jgi:hypothetical protein
MLDLGHERSAALSEDDGGATLLPTGSPLRVIVTGSRDWRSVAQVRSALSRLLARHGKVLVIHGLCPTGADRFAAEWVADHRGQGASEKPHPANWAELGKNAGPTRNGVMIDEGGDVVLAFADPCRTRKPWCPPGRHPSHGTADCVRKARAAGIPVYFCPQGMSW